MRILAIVPTVRCFGLQDLVLSYFGKLPEGITCHFITNYWSDGEFDRRLSELKIPYSSTWLGMFSRKLDAKNLKMTLECLFKLPLAWGHFLRVMRSFRPDVLYFANYHEIILLWPLLLRMRSKVICHMADPPPCILFQKINFWIWRRAVGRFLFISNNTRQRLSLLGRLTDRDVVIGTGVAIAPLDRLAVKTAFHEKFKWPADAVVFGITGQLHPHKGHEEFIAAAGRVAKGNPKVRFVIGGRGSSAFRDALEGRILDEGLTAKICFCGWLPRAQDFYEGIDVLVLASRHDEGFGLVVAEAGERGIPVIATRSGGAVEIVRDKHTGILVDKLDVDGMAMAMRYLANDVSMRKKMGINARAHIVHHFTLDKQICRFIQSLRETASVGDP